MDPSEYRTYGKQMVDIAADYLDNIENRRVLPDVKPGYLRELIPAEAPQDPEDWNSITADIERVIMPGVTHWQSPNYHAFLTGCSYESICADILSSTINIVGFSWIAGPACTELEVVVLDWLAKEFNLPSFYLSDSDNLGGGVIQSSSAESVYVTLLTAIKKKTSEIFENPTTISRCEHYWKSKFIAYTSEDAHSCVERSAKLCFVEIRKVPVNAKHQMDKKALRQMVENDKNNGLIPIYVCATMGTTNICAFDDLEEIGKICKEHDIWLHVDAAYSGAALICPEYRFLFKGLDKTDSFNFSPHKLMLNSFDCSVLWIRDRSHLVNSFNVDPLYLKHEYQSVAPDFRHWQIAVGRRFRSLKLWFVLRLYGVEGIQAYIRKHISLAKYFESLLRADNRFEIAGDVVLGLVFFKLKGSNELNDELFNRINKEGKIYVIQTQIKQERFIRFAIGSQSTQKKHIDLAWESILNCAKTLL